MSFTGNVISSDIPLTKGCLQNFPAENLLNLSQSSSWKCVLVANSQSIILKSLFALTNIFLAAKSPCDHRIVGFAFSIHFEIKGKTSFSKI